MSEEQNSENFNYQIERVIIGSVMRLGEIAYDAVGNVITDKDFEFGAHKVIWQAISQTIGKGAYIDALSLWGILSKEGNFSWGLSDLQAICKDTVGLIGLKQHAQSLAEAAKGRALQNAVKNVWEIAGQQDIEVEKRVLDSVKELEGVIDKRSGKEVQTSTSLAIEFLDRIQDISDGKVKPAEPTHLPRLDKLLSGGTRGGQLITVAARPSVGKSAFALQIILLQADKSNSPVAFFGMEMDNLEMMNRAVANLGYVNLNEIKKGLIGSSDETVSRVIEAVERIRNMPIYFHDEPALPLSKISSKIRQAVRKYGIKTIVIDYLQLMEGENPGKTDRRTELQTITRGLKQLAKQLGITIILLSQLNRDVEKRTNPKPQMSDLKETGSIEEDSDIIIALWTHKEGNKNTNPPENSILGCGVLKNRDGEKSDIALSFCGRYQQITESTESLFVKNDSDSSNNGNYGARSKARAI